MADLPAWLPSWEVLLTLFLSIALIGQVVAVVISFFTLILASEGLEHLQQQLIVVVSFIVLVTIGATTYFVGTKTDRATIQPADREPIVITLTPEEAEKIFGNLEEPPQLGPDATPALRFDIDGKIIE
ncbi:hypothetical protein [Paracoccus siganidrum]|uniref:hypothetical protein n=1 Tax=Paracoccus siganidrum TaxID=1276757 RepID=UPI001604BC89|nr:hypothetical protein [Paracoccus siganidrum]